MWTKTKIQNLHEVVSVLTRLNVVLLCSGIVALIEALSQLKVVEPHLQECVDVTCCTQVGQANKCVLGEEDRARDYELSF